jgi:AraC-like DNA-binding protein
MVFALSLRTFLPTPKIMINILGSQHQKRAIQQVSMSDEQSIHCRFNDFEALTETIRGWELDLHKLESGPFHGEFFQILSPEILLTGGFFSSRLRQRGAPPAGYRTFVVSAMEPFRMVWRGHQVTESDLLIFPPGGELAAFSNPGFSVYTLSIQESMLAGWMNPGVLEGVEVLPCNPGSINRLRQQLAVVRQTSRLRKRVLCHELTRLVAEALPARMIRTLHSRRLQIVLAAERHILAHPDEATTVQELCRTTGASKRTLEYAFRSHLGITPKRFINSIRLNGARALLRSRHPMKIADAANAWGFWHMGQFAKDYRTLFGELPSQTRAR